MKTFRWKVKPDMEVNSQPSVREVRFGDGYSQRMAAGLNADLKTYRVTLSVTREEADIWRHSWQSTEAGRHFCGSHPMHTFR
ncbi:phage tail protein [Escherichia coli]|uniref:phage tail protein n=1 Tax=Escherichia coli TaxID=562 RepID=UPI003F4C45E8